MEEASVMMPPLPLKNCRPPPGDSQTVLSRSVRDDTNIDLFSCRFPEVGRGKTQGHVVKIRINPTDAEESRKCDGNDNFMCESVSPCIRISVNSEPELAQTSSTMTETTTNGSYFYYGPFNCGIMSSGQVSPSDTLDSGTCSDLDGTPPPLPKKKASGVSVTLIGFQHKRASSLTSSGAEVDSDDNDSNVSCDSLNSGKMSPVVENTLLQHTPQVIRAQQKQSTLPQTLLQDIRQRNTKLSPAELNKTTIFDEKPYEERKFDEEKKLEEKKLEEINYQLQYETDKFYKFHLNEHINECNETSLKNVVEDETFAGIKNLLADDAGTIRSAKGTVRGVKNRVRAGIATFLQINDKIRNYKEKDAGKVVVYSTTMGIIRETYQACMKVKKIMRTLLVKFEERDVFMSNEYQTEIKERMRCDYILVPQVFVDGQHIGDAETVERLNESGELRKILKPYKTMDACTPCKVCGGFRLLPCSICNGSKKSVHRNHFTTEFVALKCMNCDEVGLVRCSYC